LYHSTLGLRVTKKKREVTGESGWPQFVGRSAPSKTAPVVFQFEADFLCTPHLMSAFCKTIVVRSLSGGQRRCVGDSLLYHSAPGPRLKKKKTEILGESGWSFFFFIITLEPRVE
jgi:hypothetical protein